MSVEGIFTDRNMDANEFVGSAGDVHIANRREIATKVTHDGDDFYRYNIVTTLNHGLARQDKPLPTGIPIQLSFSRAIATKGLIQISGKKMNEKTKSEDFAYMEKTVPIINPILSCYFVESTKADQLYNKTKLYDVSVNFLDFSLRRELLMNGIDEHRLKIFEGTYKTNKLSTIIFVFIKALCQQSLLSH